jgi:hypothetical protein
MQVRLYQGYVEHQLTLNGCYICRSQEHETHVVVYAVGIFWVCCVVMYARKLNPNVGLCALLYIRKLQL